MKTAVLFLIMLVVAPLPMPVQKRVEHDTSRTGRISGRVVTSAQLIQDATVSLIRLPLDAPDHDVSCEQALRQLCVSLDLSRSVETTTSDRWGEFTFLDVPPGRYALTVTKAGYTMRELTDIAYRTTHRITVDAHEHLSGEELLIRRDGGIEGRIIRGDGVPEEGARIVLGRRIGSEILLLAAFSTRSEADGRYEIGGLPNGEYVVLAIPQAPLAIRRSGGRLGGSGSFAAYAATLFPSALESELGETVVVGEGVVTTGIDIWLAPNPLRFFVAGTVVPPPGIAIRKVTIEYGNAADAQSKVWIVSDANGAFRIDRLSAGPLQLIARAESDRGPLVATVALEITSEPVDGLYLTLAAPGSIAGRVLEEGSLRPLPNLRIAAVPRLLGGSPLSPTPAATSGAGGDFTISKVLGTYNLELMAPPRGWRIVRAERQGKLLGDGRVTVAAGEVLDGIDVIVRPEAQRR